jgi:hypothetical protein
LGVPPIPEPEPPPPPQAVNANATVDTTMKERIVTAILLSRAHHPTERYGCTVKEL